MVHCVAKRRITSPDEQKERQGEAKNEHDALPRPAQNDFTSARLLGRIGCRLFLAHHGILAR